MKTPQKFTDEYLRQCQKMSADEILAFLEDFRKLHGEQRPEKSKLISIKVSETLLDAFRKKCALHNLRYQTQIKALMRAWVKR